MADAYQPVIIIGAARSGTNMLRDVLTSLPGVGTWPCDEINYIWRHRNARNPLDEFQPEQATDPVRRFIRGEFDRIAPQPPPFSDDWAGICQDGLPHLPRHEHWSQP